MLDKYKARFAKFEEDHESVRKVRIHFTENRNTYLVGAGCLGAGYLLRSAPDTTQILKTNPRISGIAYKSTQVINNTVVQEMVRQGEPGRKTLWVEKNLWFPSRGLAAQAANVSTSSVSKCANGIVDSVKGQHFVDGGDMI